MWAESFGVGQLVLDPRSKFSYTEFGALERNRPFCCVLGILFARNKERTEHAGAMGGRGKSIPIWESGTKGKRTHSTVNVKNAVTIVYSDGLSARQPSC